MVLPGTAPGRYNIDFVQHVPIKWLGCSTHRSFDPADAFQSNGGHPTRLNVGGYCNRRCYGLDKIQLLGLGLGELFYNCGVGCDDLGRHFLASPRAHREGRGPFTNTFWSEPDHGRIPLFPRQGNGHYIDRPILWAKFGGSIYKGRSVAEPPYGTGSESPSFLVCPSAIQNPESTRALPADLSSRLRSNGAGKLPFHRFAIRASSPTNSCCAWREMGTSGYYFCQPYNCGLHHAARYGVNVAIHQPGTGQRLVIFKLSGLDHYCCLFRGWHPLWPCRSRNRLFDCQPIHRYTASFL